jgi:hypothetical protein
MTHILNCNTTSLFVGAILIGTSRSTRAFLRSCVGLMLESECFEFRVYDVRLLDSFFSANSGDAMLGLRLFGSPYRRGQENICAKGS